jgi:hypothetical protein
MRFPYCAKCPWAPQGICLVQERWLRNGQCDFWVCDHCLHFQVGDEGEDYPAVFWCEKPVQWDVNEYEVRQTAPHYCPMFQFCWEGRPLDVLWWDTNFTKVYQDVMRREDLE